MTSRESYYQQAVVRTCFSPGAPINKRSLFAGRSTQISKGMEAVFQRGMHAIIFGERGVGKTSLANCLADFIPEPSKPEGEPSHQVACVNCTSASTYQTIWREVFSKISITRSVERMGFGTASSKDEIQFVLPDDFGPGEVQHVLNLAARQKSLIIAIDEFDKITDQPTKTLMADTIKALSDHGVDATILLVGIGDTVDELIKEHESVTRCLKEILMPRMDFGDIQQVVMTGINGYNARCKDSPLTASDDAVRTIFTLARGMPHYAHLLAQEACLVAIREGIQNISPEHVLSGTQQALEGVQQHVLSTYLRATTSAHSNALYRDVVTAAAVTKTDPLGFFPPSDVREPLQIILGREVAMGTYIKHLHEFCTEARGRVLEKKGEAWKYRFRFRDPLIPPYAVIQALGQGKVTLQMLLHGVS
jgi:Cdc6-like AAA superfamily ATPase